MWTKTIIEYGTPEYDETIALRTLVLRDPLGLKFETDDFVGEFEHFHLGLYDQEPSLVACLILQPKDDNTLKMRQVAVSPALQNMGAGTALVLFSEAFARSRGYQHIVLNARDTAIPFYLKLDYKKEGEMFIEVNIPHYKMTKQL